VRGLAAGGTRTAGFFRELGDRGTGRSATATATSHPCAYWSPVTPDGAGLAAVGLHIV
jgi:hypothetical protein